MQSVSSYEYDADAKQLEVHFTDGTSTVYHNVGVVAAAWFDHSDNKTPFWHKYIEPVYMKVKSDMKVEKNAPIR